MSLGPYAVTREDLCRGAGQGSELIVADGLTREESRGVATSEIRRLLVALEEGSGEKEGGGVVSLSDEHTPPHL